MHVLGTVEQVHCVAASPRAHAQCVRHRMLRARIERTTLLLCVPLYGDLSYEGKRTPHMRSKGLFPCGGHTGTHSLLHAPLPSLTFPKA